MSTVNLFPRRRGSIAAVIACPYPTDTRKETPGPRVPVGGHSPGSVGVAHGLICEILVVQKVILSIVFLGWGFVPPDIRYLTIWCYDVQGIVDQVVFHDAIVCRR